MNANQLANVVRSSMGPVELTNVAGDEFLIGDEITILEENATSDAIILYNSLTGEIVADGGYVQVADEAVKLGLWISY